MSKMGTFMVWALSPGEEFITQEGKISNVLGRGGDDITELTYVHEFGHALGLSDTRNVADVSNQKSDGMGIFDVMAAPMSPELTFWHRFMLGILNDDQTHCITSKEESIHWVRPVAMKTNGVKGVVIPLTENTGIAIESRRRLGFDNHLGLQSSGTLVYTIDTRITHPNSAYKLVPPARSTDREWERDTPLKVNESVTTNGWKITVLESGSFAVAAEVNLAFMPFIRLQNDFLRFAAFESGSNLLGFVVTAIDSLEPGFSRRYDAIPLRFKPPSGFLPSLRCQAGVSSLTHDPFEYAFLPGVSLYPAQHLSVINVLNDIILAYKFLCFK
jgi:hypothetical protein